MRNLVLVVCLLGGGAAHAGMAQVIPVLDSYHYFETAHHATRAKAQKRTPSRERAVAKPRVKKSFWSRWF